MLSQTIHRIPQRNTLVAIGDWNCALPAQLPHVGTGVFKWKGHTITGHVHGDAEDLLEILRHHNLAAVNCFDGQQGPTYVNGIHASRTDHAFTRLNAADREAKRTLLLEQMPAQNSDFGHRPMLVTIGHSWVPYGWAKIDKVTFQQRQRLRLMQVQNTQAWQDVQQHGHHALCNLPFTDDPDTCIHSIHKAIMPHVTRALQHQQDAPQPQQKHTVDYTNKRSHFRAMRNLKHCSVQQCFSGWFHVIRFQKLQKEHDHHNKQCRKAKIRELIAKADSCASQHDAKGLYQLINRYTPRNPTRRIRLKSADGHLISNEEEIQLYTQYIETSWAGPRFISKPSPAVPGVPFSQSELADAIRAIPVAKATAAPFVPGLCLVQHADAISHHLHPLLMMRWSTCWPFVPQIWKDGWLQMIPKANRAPTTLRNLRPLCLQEPLGTAVATLLTRKSSEHCMPQLITVPVCLSTWTQCA